MTAAFDRVHLTFHVCFLLGDHFFEFVLESDLQDLLLFLLRPADVGSPKGDTVGHEDVEHDDVGEGPVVQDTSFLIALASLEEDALGVDHHAGHEEVVDAHPTANFTQNAAQVNVVQQQKEEDGDLNRQAKVDCHVKINSITLSNVQGKNENGDAGADKRAK